MNQSQTHPARRSTRLWKQFVTLGVFSALTLGLTLGCSDENPVNTVKQTGSTTDSSFLVMSSQFSPADLDVDGLDWIDILMNTLPGVAPPNPDGGLRPYLARGTAQTFGDTVLAVSFVVNPISGWITFAATIADFLDTFTVIDSMRFRDLANATFIPTGPINPDSIGALDIRVHGSAVVVDSGEFIGTGAIHSSITIDIFGRNPNGSDTLRINASALDSLVGAAFDKDVGQCQFTATTSAALTNIVTLVDDSSLACPLSGQARVTASVDASCAGGALTFNDNWTITATFNGGTSATVVFENATTRWEVTEPCNPVPPPAVSSFHRLADFAEATIE